MWNELESLLPEEDTNLKLRKFEVWQLEDLHSFIRRNRRKVFKSEQGDLDRCLTLLGSIIHWKKNSGNFK